MMNKTADQKLLFPDCEQCPWWQKKKSRKKAWFPGNNQLSLEDIHISLIWANGTGWCGVCFTFVILQSTKNSALKIRRMLFYKTSNTQEHPFKKTRLTGTPRKTWLTDKPRWTCLVGTPRCPPVWKNETFPLPATSWHEGKGVITPWKKTYIQLFPNQYNCTHVVCRWSLSLEGYRHSEQSLLHPGCLAAWKHQPCEGEILSRQCVLIISFLVC